MIIKSFRLPVAYGAKRLCDHVLSGKDNEVILPLQGTAQDLFDMVRDARTLGHNYAIWHVVIAPAPNEPATIGQLMEVYRAYVSHFGLDASRAVIRGHQKARITSRSGVPCHHIHAMLPAFRCDDGGARVVDNSHDRRRNEFLARIAEFDLGHPLLRGKNHGWVIGELERRGRDDVADALRAKYPDDAPPPRASLSLATIQMLKRRGLSAPQLREAVRSAWRGSATAAEFHKALAGAGLAAVAGTGSPPVWIIQVDGQFLCTLAGALRGVQIITINSKLGDPTNVRLDEEAQQQPDLHPAEPSSGAEPAGARQLDLFADVLESLEEPDAVDLEHLELEPGAAADHGRADVEDAAHDQPQAGSAVGAADDAGRDPGADRAGSAAADHAADAGGGVDPAAAAGGTDQLPAQPRDRRAPGAAHGGEAGDHLRLIRRHHELIALAQLSARAAESARGRVDRRLDEIEAHALAEIMRAEAALDDSAELVEARAAVAGNLAGWTTAKARLDKARADLDQAERDLASSSWWQRRQRAERVTERRAAATKADADLDRWASLRASAEARLKIARGEMAKAQKARSAAAEPYRQQLEIVTAARGLLFRMPLIAGHGLPTLLHAAYVVDTSMPTNPEAKDLWGIPINPPVRIVPVQA